MIGVKDQNGNIIDNIRRDERSNALVFTRGKEYQQYIVIKNQAERIAQLETQVQQLIELVREQSNK